MSRGDASSHGSPDHLPWWRENLSLLLLTAGFAALALLVPASFIERVKETFDAEPVTAQASFSQELAALDAALATGEPIAHEPLRRHRIDLMLRRILSAGPLTGEQLVAIKVRLLQIEEEIARSDDPGQRDAWRAARTRELLRDYPRLSPQKLPEALDTFERQYDAAMRR